MLAETYIAKSAQHECLVRWTDSFMRDRQVTMSVDGQDGGAVDETTGLPRESPISPALFALYITDIHGAVEDQVEDSRGIPFVDDITWLVEGTDLNDVVSKLERCGAASLQWADSNAVHFETSKTEATLFSKRRKHHRCDGHTGRRPAYQVCTCGNAVAWDLAGLQTHSDREPKAADRKDPLDWGKTAPDSQ